MNRFATSCISLTIGAVLSTIPDALAQNFPAAVAQKIQSAKDQVKTIEMEEYRKIVENPGNVLIIDVREPQEYGAGHVPGAINIPRGVIEFQIWKHVGYPAALDLGKPLILQCQSGNRASLAAQTLRELGFTATTAVVMSFEGWHQSGYPLTK